MKSKTDSAPDAELQVGRMCPLDYYYDPALFARAPDFTGNSAVSLPSPTQDHINDLRPPGGVISNDRRRPTVTSHAPGALRVTPGR
jgi:hypothetical protein